MNTPLFTPRWYVFTILVAAAFAAACATHHGGTPAAAAASPDPRSPSSTPGANSLVAEGEARFKTYKCYECHGAHGEGTDDAPDLTGIRWSAEEIAAFLQKPSVHARGEGMPSIPPESPDLHPLVAFVLSLRRPQ